MKNLYPSVYDSFSLRRRTLTDDFAADSSPPRSNGLSPRRHRLEVFDEQIE